MKEEGLHMVRGAMTIVVNKEISLVALDCRLLLRRPRTQP